MFVFCLFKFHICIIGHSIVHVQNIQLQCANLLCFNYNRIASSAEKQINRKQTDNRSLQHLLNWPH